MSVASDAWLDAVGGLPCVLCEHVGRGKVYGVHVHHLFDPSQRSDWLVAALCPDCHQGPNGFHGLGGERPFRARYKIGEVELLAMTIERVEKQRRAA
jgi:hypothetical protein